MTFNYNFGSVIMPLVWFPVSSMISPHVIATALIFHLAWGQDYQTIAYMYTVVQFHSNL